MGEPLFRCKKRTKQVTWDDWPLTNNDSDQTTQAVTKVSGEHDPGEVTKAFSARGSEIGVIPTVIHHRKVLSCAWLVVKASRDTFLIRVSIFLIFRSG